MGDDDGREFPGVMSAAREADEFTKRLEDMAGRIAEQLSAACPDASLVGMAKAAFVMGWNSAEKFREALREGERE